MTESCVQEIELRNSELYIFVREVESKHGNIFTLSELYALGRKSGNEIILGVVDTAFPIIKKRDRQLLIIRLCEVTSKSHRKVFRVYAFNNFATSLADAHLKKGDYAAFRSACIRETSQYRTERGCHHLEAHIGIPEQPNAKIFFARRSHITNVAASKHQHSSKNCTSSDVAVERNETPVTFSREPTPHTLVRGSSPGPTEMSFNSSRMSPIPLICDTVLPSVLPRTPSSRVPQTQNAYDNIPLALQNPQDKYTYTKLSELVEPDKRVNIYGVIHTIVKIPTEHCKHAIVWLKDETCGSKEFRVHIFFSRETAFPKLEHGYILRLHRLKTELFEGMIDGRVFHATDIVTFPPEGQGIADAFSTSKCFHFCDVDAKRLTELRRWIASSKQQKSLPADPPSSSLSVTSNTALLSPVLSSEPTKSRLCEIKKEGNYVLHCKVLGIDKPSDEMHIFTVIDGTSFIYCFHRDEDERHATEKVRIVVLNPLEVKNIETGALVELTNVTVQVTVPPDTSQCNWPFLSLKMNGNNCSVKSFKGLEPEAKKLKRQLQDARLNKQLRPADFVDEVITELRSEFPRQADSGNHKQVADTVTNSSVQNECKQPEAITDSFTGNNHPVQQYLVSSGGEQNLQFEEEQCSPSLMLHAEEEELNCQALQKTVVEQAVTNEQVHLGEESIFTGNVKQKRGNADGAVLSDKQQKISAESRLNKNCVQGIAEEISETYADFAAGVQSGCNAQFCSSTQPTGNQNTDPVLNMECLGDPKVSEVESEASEMVQASDVDSLDSPGKFSALTQMCLRNTGLSNKLEAETLVFMDVFSDASPADSDSQASVPGKVQKSCVLVEHKGNCKCAEECGRSPSGAVQECTDEDEDMECQSAERHSGSVGCKEKFASGIATSVQGIATDISYIKRKRLQNGEQRVYLLKAWVKDIEPPINNGSEMNIISGLCNRCNSTQSYEALKKGQKNQMLCQYCFQKGLKIPVTLRYLLRLHLIDENNDELIGTVTAHHGVDLLGCTVNAYLYDSMANKRVVKILTELIAKSKNVPPENRGPLLKFLVTPIHTSMGAEYIIHSTYLYNMQYSEEQRNS